MNVEDSGSASETFFESTFIILFTSSPCFIRSALGGHSDEQRARIRRTRARRAVEADDAHKLPDSLSAREDFLHFFHHLVRALQRIAFGKLLRDLQVVVILLGNEALRGNREKIARKNDKPDVQNKYEYPVAQNAFYEDAVFARSPLKRAVERAEEPAEAEVYRAGEEVGAFVRIFNQQHAKRGRERQRNYARDNRRGCNRERELLVELPRNALDKRGRHKHRAEHERYRNQRVLDVAHCLARGLAHVHSELHVALDVFDDDDCVVDDNPDCQHDSEKRNVVDQKPERPD